MTTTDNKAPRELINKIRRYHELNHHQFHKCKKLTDAEFEELHLLHTELAPVDVLSVVIDAYLAVKQELDEARSIIEALESSRLPDYLHEIVRGRNQALEKRIEKCEGLLRELESKIVFNSENQSKIDQYFAENKR